MQVGALAPYERSLRDRSPLQLVAEDGQLLDLDVPRWLDGLDEADRSVLARCEGAVLDVGCGPGRFVHAAAELGLPSLGLDIAATAVSLTRRRGGYALLRSVFDPMPGEGRWPTALLMDGNIGIGGDVILLLERVRALLAPGGRLLVETSATADVDRVLRVRFNAFGVAVGPRFGWAEVGLPALTRYAVERGYSVEETWSCAGRTFAALAR